LKKIDDRDYINRLIQDLRVRLRDEENIEEQIKMQKIIKKFEKGLKEDFLDNKPTF
jgi:hypothetical protein